MDWLALIVRPNHERAVAEQLVLKSLETYLPLYRTRRQWSDRMKLIERPLFPRYVFCRFSFDDRIRVLNTFGVTSLLSFGGKPSHVSEDEIGRIKRLTSADMPLLPWRYVRVGQRVRIIRGALADLEGVLVREKGVDRVVVNVDILQRAVAMEIDRDLIEPISASHISVHHASPVDAAHRPASKHPSSILRGHTVMATLGRSRWA